MNKRIASPLIVNLITPTEDHKVARNGRRVYVPVNTNWQDFTSAVNPSIQNEQFDSVIVHIDKNVPMDEKGIANSVNIKISELSRTATKTLQGKPVLSDASKESWYWMNPPYEEQTEAPCYAPSDDAVIEKFKTFGTADSWQEHQAAVWSRMADMMPLSNKEGFGTPNHVAALTAKNRGLERKDLDKFWSFHSNRLLTPSILGDDMIGMPGVEGREYDGFTIVIQGADGQVREQPLSVKSLKTVGMSGIAIPMENKNGHTPKYQIATDPSKINVMLRARTADGVSIQKSEYFDKKRNVFTFRMEDGRDSNLRIVSAAPNGSVGFSDIKGSFDGHMKADMLSVLKERGYDIPPLVASLQVIPNAKYIWQSKGTMVGSNKVCDLVSPSNAGFVLGREPKNGKDDYVVLVVEGALKGRIVAKYADVSDRDGKSFGDYIAKDSGIIVAQVPGVSKAFVESVEPIYGAYNIKGTYIAMDADGRNNLAVAQGISTAYHCLADFSPVRVMSWNPEQKGMDDALLAIAQGRITLDAMGLRFGPPEKLFPLDQASAPNPYHLDGTRANSQEWKLEYAQDRTKSNAKIQALQAETMRRAAEALAAKNAPTDAVVKARELEAGSEELSRNLPPKDASGLLSK